jgi:uncharacterized coiled-coil DUF342 family protein
MTSSTSWNVTNAKTIFAKLTKIANEQLDVAAEPAEDAGSAGPQEVVDALEVIVQQLEEVQEAIPAESSIEEEVPEQVEAPVEVPEEPEVVGKLKSQVAALTSQLDSINKEKIASDYAELFDEPKVQQAKYDEVISSKKDSAYWSAQIQAIGQFKQDAGVSSYKPAQATNSWVQPRTKVAKQGSGMMRL